MEYLSEGQTATKSTEADKLLNELDMILDRLSRADKQLGDAMERTLGSQVPAVAETEQFSDVDRPGWVSQLAYRIKRISDKTGGIEQSINAIQRFI